VVEDAGHVVGEGDRVPVPADGRPALQEEVEGALPSLALAEAADAAEEESRFGDGLPQAYVFNWDSLPLQGLLQGWLEPVVAFYEALEEELGGLGLDALELFAYVDDPVALEEAGLEIVVEYKLHLSYLRDECPFSIYYLASAGPAWLEGSRP